MTLKKRGVEDIVRKGENEGNLVKPRRLMNMTEMMKSGVHHHSIQRVGKSRRKLISIKVDIV